MKKEYQGGEIGKLQLRSKYKKVDFSCYYVKASGEIIRITTWMPQFRCYATVSLRDFMLENRETFIEIQKIVDNERRELR